MQYLVLRYRFRATRYRCIKGLWNTNVVAAPRSPSCDADVKRKNGSWTIYVVVTADCGCHRSSDRNANIMRPRMISYLVLRCCFHATRYEMNEGLADIKCCCRSHFAVVVAIAQHGILTSCACIRYLKDGMAMRCLDAFAPVKC